MYAIYFKIKRKGLLTSLNLWLMCFMFRNKEEGYFIASELLKKICSSHKGAEAVRKSPAHLKRLRTLVEELSRKSCNEKRSEFSKESLFSSFYNYT